MNDPIYEEEKNGVTLKIYQDDSPHSPEEDRDEGLFLVGYHRQFFVDRIKQSLAQCIAHKGKYEDGSINEEAKDYIKEYHIFGLEAYIHSGVRLALSREGNFPDRQWDVSQLGLVFASKEEWKTRAKAKKAVLGLIEYWNDYLNSNVYGYVIEDEEGEHLDSCWGFYGDYEAEDGCLSEARNVIEHHIKEKAEEKKNLNRLVKQTIS